MTSFGINVLDLDKANYFIIPPKPYEPQSGQLQHAIIFIGGSPRMVMGFPMSTWMANLLKALKGWESKHWSNNYPPPYCLCMLIGQEAMTRTMVCVFYHKRLG